VADLIPTGYDRTTGIVRPITDGDTLTDPAGGAVISGGGGGDVSVRAYRTADLAAPAIGVTAIPLTATSYDPDGFHSGSDAGFVVPSGFAGRYEVHGNVEFTLDFGSTQTMVGIIVWDTNAKGSKLREYYDGGYMNFLDSGYIVSMEADLAVNNFVEFVFWRLGIFATGPIQANSTDKQTWMSMRKID
jgi:hypothetical protein